MGTTTKTKPERLVILRRKEVGNPRDFFAKSFTEYREGFKHNGESWIGLEKLHRLTSEHSYGLKIIMTDFDKKKYVAFYNQFKVGAGEGYQLTVKGFQSSTSSLYNGMKHNHGMKFTTRDNDQDGWLRGNCARSYGGGGWWYANCGNVRPTGLHLRTRRRRTKRSHQSKNIVYYSGGARGNTYNSWAEAKFILVPKK